MKRLSIKARVTAWFAIVMFLIATGVFCVMTLHRSAQVKSNAERNLTVSVEGFAAFTVQENGVLENDRKWMPQENKDIPGRGGMPRANEVPPMPDNAPFAKDGGKPRTYAGGVHLAVFDEQMEIKVGMIPFNLEVIDFDDGRIRTLTSGGEKYLVLDKKVTVSDGSILWVKGITNISGAQGAANSTVAADYLLICILIAIAAVGGYFIVG
ncbi:MAG: hypothetical protein IJ367_02935, partial [Clostridia bacterium]|nr:hypothetical protein [Clostridia bacterium]